MIVRDALTAACDIFKNSDIETPVKEAGVLLAFVLKQDVSWLYAHPEALLPMEIFQRYLALIQKRKEGMPFQYISNHQEFMSLDFYVTPHCLIPRPDTEILVEAALSQFTDNPYTGMRILDIGTGSGAVGISIAHYNREVYIDALDLSDEALQIAEYNAKIHHVENRIRFIRGNLLEWEPEKPYAFVVSNPPYIPRSELAGLMKGVREYEPEMALDGGEDGLAFYRSISSKIPRLLIPGGSVLVEVGLGQADAVKELFREQGLEIKDFFDLAGICRVICGKN